MTQAERPATLLGLVRGTVERHAELPALDLGDRVLDYRELWNAAGVLGAALGATRADVRRVGLLAHRGVTAYAGYLGALRIGATVVPMNPDFPHARNAAIATVGEVDVVLTDGVPPAGLAAALARSGTPVVDGTARRDPCLAPADPAVRPSDVAYVLFTSGSTGRPKGVPISNANAVAYLEHVVPRYELGPGCRLSQMFDLTFDPSVFDLFAAWASGATLVVPTRAESMMPAAYVSDRKITHWFSVPSVAGYARRLRLIPADSMRSLRYSVFIGEPLTFEQAESWATAAPDSVIENVYGPTELTVSCTEYRLHADRRLWPKTSNGTVPIGPVYDHLDSLIVDDDGRHADEGHLCVRGSQRFAGYVDEQDNSGKFMSYDHDGPKLHTGSTPITPLDWYRTGDRVRIEDGNLVHLGRIDRQVKVRGYRVELGEIEFALRSLDGVLEAAVVAREGGLHAFHVGEGTPETLRVSLARSLPGYMVPAEFHRVDSLPLNVNGKTDYPALAARVAGA